MITRAEIIKELEKFGYKAEEYDTVKNGVVFEGVRIHNGSNVVPVVYVEQIIDDAEESGNGLEYAVGEVVRIYESNKKPKIDLDLIFSADFIRDNLYIALQKSSDEKIVKRSVEDLDGIESYLFIRQENDGIGQYSIKLNYDLLKKSNILEEEAWSIAESNTFAETIIESLAKVMSDMHGTEYDESIDELIPIAVVTNIHRTRGASAILDKKMLKEFATEHGCNQIIAIPSSIHEFLIAPLDESVSVGYFSEMVANVNDEVVPDFERLADKAFLLNV